MKKIELLSPVGNMEMLYQAIHNGADAVYLAGKNYGARKYSNNFTNEELIEVIKYSHLYDVKVYITVNTIIYEKEIEKFIKYIEFLYKNGVDALIIQDIGMIHLIKQIFPNIELHASTQCHNHNKGSVKLLKKLGCSRVVMARELSLEEINNIDVDIEKEVFVHGALCVCYSGCCLFSSLNGGRSGNRGECVGSCRLPYKLIKNNKEVILKDKYILSTKELNTLTNLKDILNSNITSLKIEGRMKSSAYVGFVTKLYRTLIDKYYNNEEMKITEEETKKLKKLYNRKFTNGYLFNNKDIMNITSPNHQGIEIGKVINLNKKYITIKLIEDINQKDGIRFKESNTGMIINKLYNKKKLLVNSIPKNKICLIPNKINLRNKDTVLKTQDNKLETSLKKYSKKKIDISIIAKLKIGHPINITITDNNNFIIKDVGPIIEKAITKEVTNEEIKRGLSKLGNTPFKANNITIIKDDNIFISLKEINIIRRNLIEKLIKIRTQNKKAIKINNNINFNNYIKKDNLYHLNALVRTEEQLKCCLENNIDNIYVTNYKLYNKYKHNKQIYYRVPRVNYKYIDFNNSNLLVGDSGSIYKYKKNNNVIGDYYLNIANSYSIKTLNQLGIKRVTLSVELNDSRIKDIMNENYNVELIIYGRLELMIMKYCPLKKCLNYCKDCQNKKDTFFLKDRLNNNYPIINENCITHIMHHTKINKINKIDLYKDIGINNFRLEFFEEDYNEVKKYIQKTKNML
ncbi:MAG: U32 family peptidase [Bacilli bacterium]|nr:U32 family peptidase [Bacilli bacterium]